MGTLIVIRHLFPEQNSTTNDADEDLLCDGVCSYLLASLMMYGWSIIPFVYLQSFLCKVAASAYAWVTVFNLFTGAISVCGEI